MPTKRTPAPASKARPRRSRKKASSSQTRTPRSESALDRLSDDEQGKVLRTLLRNHPDLQEEAETIALEMVAEASAGDTADELYERLTSLTIEELNGRAGRQSLGYVDPTEAAWAILAEAIEDLIDDMNRRMDLGQEAPAIDLCCGIILGLHRVDGFHNHGLLDWAEDFPREKAQETARGLLDRCRPGKLESIQHRLERAINELAPECLGMLGWVPDSKVRARLASRKQSRKRG